MAQRTKSKQMKIKQPSLKGMKNTSYLGHFAKDEFIKQGHNFSGSYNLAAGTPSGSFTNVTMSDISGTSNAFEAGQELQKRKKIVEDELASMEQERLKKFGEFSSQMPSNYETFGDSPQASDARFRQAQLSTLRSMEDARARGQIDAYRVRSKKFLEEL